MRSYEAARAYFSFLSFIAWCVIIAGIFVALAAFAAIGQSTRGFGGPASGIAYFAAMVPGAGISFLGFLGLVLVQIGRARVDSAEYAQQSLKIAREQLEISKQGLKQGAKFEAGYAALQAAREELTKDKDPGGAPPIASYGDRRAPDQEAQKLSHQPGDTIEYKGKEIRVIEAGFVFGGQVYAHLDDAYAHVDEDDLALNSPAQTKAPYASQLGVNPAPTLGGVTRR